jgi:hypothetical protein
VLVPRKRFPADVAQNKAPKAAEIKINLAFVTQNFLAIISPGAERRQKYFLLSQLRLSRASREKMEYQALEFRLKTTGINDPLTKNLKVSSVVCLSLMDFCV